ncbi:hypothetical protein FNV43_RR13380 [Rhamnella rubrinervis]|uniref:DUF4228 domain-containing protein n=1 Tax=Rhamnella rubrinervis TaxID=2594499 RepID=A0A8K0MF38_9ROSA|nr:hypothetical protein FNV43_RR13380 [Rhamnella rubrinervis]
MGNCLRSNKVLVEAHNDALIPKEEEAIKEETQPAICSTTPSKLESIKEGKKKKVVRFRLPEDEQEKELEENKENINNSSNGEDSNRGVVRIKLVLTREELKQVVDFMNGSDQDDHSSSVQQFLNVIKSRGQRVSEAREGLANGSWRPVLESIAED